MEKILNIKRCWIGALIISAFFIYLQTSSYAMDLTLQWDANTEPDLAGYRVYYKIGSSGPPYNGTGATDGDSPIDAGNVTDFTFHGLTDDVTYFFVVTAYDTEDLESGYSNQVSTAEDTGAGAGGCFIATAAFGFNTGTRLQILHGLRDKHPANNHSGRTFTAPYNSFPLPVADFLHRHPSSRAAVRRGLMPKTNSPYLVLNVHPVALLSGFILLLLAAVYLLKQSAIGARQSPTRD